MAKKSSTDSVVVFIRVPAAIRRTFATLAASAGKKHAAFFAELVLDRLKDKRHAG